MPAEVPAVLPVELILPGTPTHEAPVEDAVDGKGDLPGDGDIARGVEGTVVDMLSELLTDVVGGGALKPPGSSSVEPIGIPTRPTAASPPMPVGDDADAVDLEAAPPIAAHVPDALPALMPASNSAVGSAMPVVRAAEPPQTALLPVMALCGTLPATAGLTPGDASCVAPSGTPTGGTGAAGPMPSGDVIPSGDVMPNGGGVTCARAGCAPASAAAAARIDRYFIEDSIPDSARHAQPRLRWYLLGVCPVIFRKVAVNELVSLKPSFNPISVTEWLRPASITFACSMRRPMW